MVYIVGVRFVRSYSRVIGGTFRAPNVCSNYNLAFLISSEICLIDFI